MPTQSVADGPEEFLCERFLGLLREPSVDVDNDLPFRDVRRTA